MVNKNKGIVVYPISRIFLISPVKFMKSSYPMLGGGVNWGGGGGGSPCYMSIIRNGNVDALSHLRKAPVALLILRKTPVTLSNLRKAHIKHKKGRVAVSILGVYTPMLYQAIF